MDILPSVVATIIGAYIVNHYIATKPAADAPVAAAAATADPKADAKPSGTSAFANIPEPGVKAKGISERAMIEKSAAEQPATAEKPAETAGIPPETHRHQPVLREKTIAKAAPAPQPSAPAPAAVAAAPNPVSPAEAATPAEERRDANDLARAAIERLRGANDGSQRPQEATRAPDGPRIPDAPRVVLAPLVPATVASAPPVRPLPPPIMVSSPSAETSDPATGSLQMRSAYPVAVDPRRPTPPADIPLGASLASRPMDLRAEVAEPVTREHTTVAEDVLSAAKSVFHAVLPKKLIE
jgi:hypothetical protein